MDFNKLKRNNAPSSFGYPLSDWKFLTVFNKFYSQPRKSDVSKSVKHCNTHWHTLQHIPTHTAAHTDLTHYDTHTDQSDLSKSVGVCYAVPLTPQLWTKMNANIGICDVALVPLNKTEQGRSVNGTRTLGMRKLGEHLDLHQTSRVKPVKWHSTHNKSKGGPWWEQEHSCCRDCLIHDLLRCGFQWILDKLKTISQ